MEWLALVTLYRTIQLGLGSAPAHYRPAITGRFAHRICPCVRREAHRTAAGAAALPNDFDRIAPISTASFRPGSRLEPEFHTQHRMQEA